MKKMLLACASALALAVPAQAATIITYEASGRLFYEWEEDVTGIIHNYSQASTLHLAFVEGGYSCGYECETSATRVWYYSYGYGGEEVFRLFFDGTSGNPPTDVNSWLSGTYTNDHVFGGGPAIWITGVMSSLSITVADGDPSGYEYGKFWITADGPMVPEPATWAMMLSGFGIIGAAMRRRNASVAFA